MYPRYQEILQHLCMCKKMKNKPKNYGNVLERVNLVEALTSMSNLFPAGYNSNTRGSAHSITKPAEKRVFGCVSVCAELWFEGEVAVAH